MKKTALLIAGFAVGESGHGAKEHRGLQTLEKKTNKQRKWILSWSFQKGKQSC